MEYEIKLAHMNNIYHIVELLNTVTLTLYERNINQWEYPWDIEKIKSNISSRYTLSTYFSNTTRIPEEKYRTQSY